MTPEPLIIPSPPELIRTEIVRSFSYRLNVGDYEHRDFFCSQKAECAIGDAERVSDQLYEFCRRQVLKAVKQYIDDKKRQKMQQAATERKSA